MTLDQKISMVHQKVSDAVVAVFLPPLMGGSQLLFLYIVIKTIRGGEKAPAKPWDGGLTLEWTVPSPAPYHTFETPPVVK